MTSILRTVPSFRILGKHDLTYELIPLAFWSSVPLCHAAYIFVAENFSRDAEMASGIICGCMPVMPQFFRHFMPRIRSRFSSYRRSKAASDPAGLPSNENVVAPWGKFDDSRKLKSRYLDVDLQSVGQTTDTDREHIQIYTRQVSDDPIIQDKATQDLEKGLC